MYNYKLVETFSEFKEFKNIDREAMMRIIEDVFRGMLNKKFDTDTNDFIDIIVNVDKGDFEIYHNRTVVEDDELTDPLRQIKLSDAIKIEPDFEVGEEVIEQIQLSHSQSDVELFLIKNFPSVPYLHQMLLQMVI